MLAVTPTWFILDLWRSPFKNELRFVRGKHSKFAYAKDEIFRITKHCGSDLRIYFFLLPIKSSVY